MTAATEHDIDLPALRTKYRQERDRRIRPDGPGQYASAMRGEFGYYAKDPYTPRAEREPSTARHTVLLIGAGFGGLLTGARLREAGITDIALMDEAGDVGGTWYWNRYPGIHCDIESTVYMPLLDELGTAPTRRYASGEEIRKHSIAIAEHYDLYRSTYFHTRATKLDWDDEANEWTVETDRGDAIRARYVVISTGTLTQPKLPGIPGIADFAGHTFHTSRWDYAYTGGTQEGGLTGLAGKRVAVVGTGATGIQVIPQVAEHAAELIVFQRTPSTVDVRDNRDIAPDWAAGLEPGWQRRRMDNFMATVSGEPQDEDMIGDRWTANATLHRKVITGRIDDSSPAAERELAEELADARTMNGIRARVDEVVHDPATAELLKPWYRYMCKRPTFSDLYLQTFNRDNVTLVDTADTHGITRMTATGVVVGEREYEVDCVIFATGFDVGVSGVMSGALPVHGRGGQQLLHYWGAKGLRTLHGFYSPGFPNFFQLGPLQNANAVSFVHILADQAEHITEVVRRAEETGAVRVEPTEEATEVWQQTLRETAVDTTAFMAECTPGYYNLEGNPFQMPTYAPGPLAFRRVLREWRETSLDDDVLVTTT